MSDDWYCRLNGQEFGPMPLEELTARFQRRPLGPGDVVRRGTRGAWMPADSFDPTAEPNASADEEIAHAPATDSAPQSHAPSGVRWYCRTPDGERGPLNWDELREMAIQGKLSECDSIRQATAETWVAAGRIQRLFAEPDAPGETSTEVPPALTTETLPSVERKPSKQADPEPTRPEPALAAASMPEQSVTMLRTPFPEVPLTVGGREESVPASGRSPGRWVKTPPRPEVPFAAKIVAVVVLFAVATVVFWRGRAGENSRFTPPSRSDASAAYEQIDQLYRELCRVRGEERDEAAWSQFAADFQRRHRRIGVALEGAPSGSPASRVAGAARLLEAMVELGRRGDDRPDTEIAYRAAEQRFLAHMNAASIQD